MIFLPLFALISLCILIINGRPIIFKQTRVGKDEKLFTIYKFCTMNQKLDINGELLADSQRLNWFGKLLRNLSLDELPQLFNVIKGDMAFIGPRPLRVSYLELYSEEQRKRHDVKPGITGWAQVNGRNAISWEEKFRLDVYYTEHRNLKLDLKICLLTIQKVLLFKGVSAEGQATVQKFQGS
ncbi:sugar transferase [Listeria booriae]|uniref:Sugar transferase n=2 Tax=Listeria booriae TaxID=1552123 RepID=A0A7X0XIS4_9LIST|nr:sugar transferase [Listeria booriae]MBC1574023.1 sugar transferase [Listeria booriae]MBC2321747.1 sugar transferase [Listeria booriae]